MERVPQSINERRVFIDTSAFLAITDRKDSYHHDATAVLDRLAKGRYRLFTTMYVVVETHAGLLRAISVSAGHEFLIHGLDQISLLPIRREDEAVTFLNRST